MPPTSEDDMSEQTPEPTVDENAVEPEKTTNDLSKQDDVWVDEDQDPVVQPRFGDAPEDDAEGGAQ